MSDRRCGTCKSFLCLVSQANPQNSGQMLELGDCTHPANEAKTWTAAFGFERNGSDRCEWWEIKPTKPAPKES